MRFHIGAFGSNKCAFTFSLVNDGYIVLFITDGLFGFDRDIIILMMIMSDTGLEIKWVLLKLKLAKKIRFYLQISAATTWNNILLIFIYFRTEVPFTYVVYYVYV